MEMLGTLLAFRDISLVRNDAVALGVKRTSLRPAFVPHYGDGAGGVTKADGRRQ